MFPIVSHFPFPVYYFIDPAYPLIVFSPVFFEVPQTEGTLHLAILKMSVARYGSILRDQVPRTPYNASNIHVLGIYTVAF